MLNWEEWDEFGKKNRKSPFLICFLCGAAIPNDGGYPEKHQKWHEKVNDETILTKHSVS